MTFDVAADAYERFMGRISVPLAARFADLLEVRPGATALDVGCGPGALTAQLVERLGVSSVAAIDPSPPFVERVVERFPTIDARVGVAEALPYPDRRFDLAAAQLVVHFMSDPRAALREMARVTRDGGTVAACVWDHAGEHGPLAVFWRAVLDLHPGADDESGLPGTGDGDLHRLFLDVGMADARATSLTVRVTFETFDDWWAPFTLGVGPAGAFVGSLSADEAAELRRRCAALLPPAPFAIEATAWTVLAHR